LKKTKGIEVEKEKEEKSRRTCSINFFNKTIALSILLYGHKDKNVKVKQIV
jgi:hypothetical protein